MWMLLATLCLQTSLTTAECRSERHGPYLLHSDCQTKVAPLRAELQRLADDLGARVIFQSVHCEKGHDL